MSKSTIEWTDWTSNPIGVKDSRTNYCVKISPGCKHCYAEVMARRLSAISHDASFMSYRATSSAPEMELREHVLGEWMKLKKPRKIFVGSMTDIFGSWVKYQWLVRIFDTMVACPHLTFQILTKRAGRMRRVVETYLADHQMDSLPPNIWVGISAENDEWYHKRLPDLIQTKAQVRFLSCEPLLGDINLALAGTAPKDWRVGYRPIGNLIHWVIAGGESGHEARPVHPDWVRSIQKQCDYAVVPFFFKQWGSFRQILETGLR